MTTEYAPLDVNYAVKAQWIRVADVVAIGPLMVWGGARVARTGSPLLGAALGALGLATVAFNGYNWWRVRQAITSARADAATSAAGAGLLAFDAQGQPPS